ADAARNVYRFASILSRDQHSGHYTVALPAGTSAESRMFFERAFTRPPAFQSSFDQDIEIWWTALDLTSEDSMLHQRGMELAQQIDREPRDLLWSFPRTTVPAKPAATETGNVKRPAANLAGTEQPLAALARNV